MASRPAEIARAHHACGDDHSHAHDALPADHDRGHSHDHGHECCAADPSPPSSSSNASLVTARIPVGYTLTRLRVAEMDCPTEEALIRNKLGGLATVSGMEFNLMQRVLTVVHKNNTLAVVETAIRDLGMSTEPMETSSQGSARHRGSQQALVAVGAGRACRAECGNCPLAWLAGMVVRTAGTRRHHHQRYRHFQEGLDCVAPRQSQHQRPDEHCRDGCGIAAAVAGSGHGHGSVYSCRVDRGEVLGSGTQCHSQPAAAHPGNGNGTAGGRRLGRVAGQGRGHRPNRARANLVSASPSMVS
jgi:hypothetical protein